jgi:hypothetical protein
MSRSRLNVEINESSSYEAWTVSSDFGTAITYRIYMKVLDPGRGRKGQPDFRPTNLFANKHLGQDAEMILRMRRFQGVSESAKWEAMEKLGVRLNPALNPTNPPHTNTVIDFNKIDRKNAAFLIAKALLEGMISGRFQDYHNTKESAYLERFQVNFGIPCVVSAGNLAGVETAIQIGVKRVSKLNPQRWVSFEVNHCAGAVTPAALP